MARPLTFYSGIQKVSRYIVPRIEHYRVLVSNRAKRMGGDPGSRAKVTHVIDLTKEEDDDGDRKRKRDDEGCVRRETEYMLPFQLLKTRGIPKEYQQGPLGFDMAQHVSGDIKAAFVSNYMMDIPWLVDTCPDLFFSDILVLAHGMQGASEGMKKQLKMLGVEGAEILCPWVPPYGTHHTKAFFLQYERGIRIIIHTANLLYCDVNNKSQSVFMQDFPTKAAGDESVSDFEHELIQYMERLGLGQALERRMKTIISMHDYRYARGHIVSSVPSKPFEFKQHGQWGHARVAAILRNEVFDASYAHAPILAQFSSIGNISDKFMREITESFSAGQFEGAPSHPPPDVQLVWPTVSEVRDSLEGFFGGGSLCGYSNRFQKSIVMDRIHRWGGQAAGRQRALPHLKTYLRYTRQDQDETTLPWVLLASHNFSKAAWGEFVQSRKYGAKLFRILSYEMGILLLPRLELAYRNSPQCGFSCTHDRHNADEKKERIEAVDFVPWKKGVVEREYMDDTTLRVPIPLPFELPPARYPDNTAARDAYESTPWTVTPDPTHGNVWHGIDALGNPYPGKGSYQGVLQRDTDEDLWCTLFSSSSR